MTEHQTALTWLSTDLHLLETDAHQLRLHLGWLAEDLRAHREQLGGQAAAVECLVAEAADCLARLAHLDEMLTRLRSAVAA